MYGGVEAAAGPEDEAAEAPADGGDVINGAWNADRVSLVVSWLDGACSGDGGSAVESKPSIRQRTITSSRQARESIKSP